MNEIQRLEAKLDRLTMLVEVLISGEKLHNIGGYAHGRNNGGAFIDLYPAAAHLRYKACKVYEEQFDQLPGFVDTAVPADAPATLSDRNEAQRRKLYRPCPPFTIAVRDGKETQTGPEQRFSRVVDAPTAAKSPNKRPKNGRSDAQRPPQAPEVAQQPNLPHTAEDPFQFRAFALAATTADAFATYAYRYLAETGDTCYREASHITAIAEKVDADWRPNGGDANLKMVKALSAYCTARQAAEQAGATKRDAHYGALGAARREYRTNGK